jgi:hypothetical protein
VASLKDMLALALALQNDSVIRVVRGKFRFARDYDPVRACRLISATIKRLFR